MDRDRRHVIVTGQLSRCVEFPYTAAITLMIYWTGSVHFAVPLLRDVRLLRRGTMLTVILIVLVILLLFGGGGFYARGRR